MEENFKSFFKETKDSVIEYVNLRIRLFKLETTARLSKMMGTLCALVIAALFFSFCVLFLGFAFAYWMMQLTGSMALSCVITAGAFIFIALLIIALRRWLIIRPVMRLMITMTSDKLNEGN